MSARLCLIRDFVALAKTDVVADGNIKLKYHSLGRRVLCAVAKELGLQSGTYDIRSNLGGPAVAGEITLHGEHLYIQFREPISGLEVLYRTCEGRKDYTGGVNHWMKYEDLYDLPRACEKFKALTEGN